MALMLGRAPVHCYLQGREVLSRGCSSASFDARLLVRGSPPHLSCTTQFTRALLKTAVRGVSEPRRHYFWGGLAHRQPRAYDRRSTSESARRAIGPARFSRCSRRAARDALRALAFFSAHSVEEGGWQQPGNLATIGAGPSEKTRVSRGSCLQRHCHGAERAFGREGRNGELGKDLLRSGQRAFFHSCGPSAVAICLHQIKN